jgi:hypothetical protein
VLSVLDLSSADRGAIDGAKAADLSSGVIGAAFAEGGGVTVPLEMEIVAGALLLTARELTALADLVVEVPLTAATGTAFSTGRGSCGIPLFSGTDDGFKPEREASGGTDAVLSSNASLASLWRRI